MAHTLLSARNVRKTYGGGSGSFEALRGVTLDIQEGESLAILGKSGSGKSTLMHLLALLDSPTDGTIMLDGQDTADLSRRRINRTRNKTFGFIFQQFFLNPHQTVLENVMLPLKIAGLERRARRQRAMSTLEQLELDDKARNRGTDLSGGQKQRVAIARALVANPRIIFADEPTGNLDSVTGELVNDILFDLNRDQEITMVFVTHDADLAARCDRQIIISDGRILRDQFAAPDPRKALAS
ncbi:MAG: ABC transporter ATP-binding protein [Propioniciclava sp.]